MNGRVLDLQSVTDRCRDLAGRGKRIVLTNGCFDLLHVGHVRNLRRASELGDVLVVAVNGDESVRALKGPDRPVVAEAARAEVVAGLGCVDYVTIFNAPTAEQIIAVLQPHVYVKGGDYRPGGEAIPEARVVASYGGTTVLLDLERGVSTSALIRAIRAGQAQPVACEVASWR